MEWPDSTDALLLNDWSSSDSITAGATSSTGALAWALPTAVPVRQASAAMLLATPPVLAEALSATVAVIDSTTGFIWPTPVDDADATDASSAGAPVPTLSDADASSASGDLPSDDDQSQQHYLAGSADPFLVGSADVDFSSDDGSSFDSEYSSPAASDQVVADTTADAAVPVPVTRKATPAPSPAPRPRTAAGRSTTAAARNGSNASSTSGSSTTARPKAGGAAAGGQYGRPLRRGKVLTKEEYEARLERARIRQEKNRAAAKKCRLRKQEHYKELIVDVKVLRDENTHLRQTIAGLVAQLSANGLQASAEAVAAAAALASC